MTAKINTNTMGVKILSIITTYPRILLPSQFVTTPLPTLHASKWGKASFFSKQKGRLVCFLFFSTRYKFHYSRLYLWFGLKNLSHMCNSGDQMVNFSLRNEGRRATKLRAVEHFLAIQRADVAPSNLEMVELVMKPLLSLSVGE